MTPQTESPAERSARLVDLLARTALGDQRAFEDLYGATSAHLYGVALRMFRERALAEEVVQDAYIAIWRHAGSYVAAQSQPLTWLTAIVRNRCLDQLRKRELDTVSMTPDDDTDDGGVDIPSPADSPELLLMQGADAQSVRECVDQLEGGSKQAIALAFFRGFTHAELASHLGEPLGTVKSWVRRGLDRLRHCLDHAGVVR